VKNSCTDIFRTLLGLVAALTYASFAWGYSFITNDSGQALSWPAGSITMHIMVDNTTALSDGTTRATSIQAAMLAWNAQIGSVQFSPLIAAAGSGTDKNNANELFFSAAPYDYGWDNNTLAITTIWYSGTQMKENDMIFNTAYTWDSYRGAQHANNVIDIHRIALHELGHVLGLDHPDDHGQSVTAIMNSTVSDIDSLQADDIAGAQSLYGLPNSPPAMVGQPANQSVYAGQSAQFSASATGHPAPTYNWQRLPTGGGSWANLGESVNYSGTATATLSVGGTVLAASGDQFRCVASNGSGSATSNAATLTVIASTLPSFTTQPAGQTVTEGQPVTFTATATGVPPPTYQWKKGGVPSLARPAAA